MPEPEPRPARVVSQEDIPMPPPGRPRRAAILVQTIGDLSLGETGEDDPTGDEVRAPAVVRIIGGAGGDDRAGGDDGDDDGDEITAIGGIRIIGSGADDDLPGGQ